jgi:hypothetical protein
MLFQAAARKAASKHAWKNGSRNLIFRQVLGGPAVSKIPVNASNISDKVVDNL